jgi:hypothetical protein
MNRLEKKALHQININEGIISKIAKAFLSVDFIKAQKALARMKKDDPELAAGMASLDQTWKIIQQELDRTYSENPGLKDRIERAYKNK